MITPEAMKELADKLDRGTTTPTGFSSAVLQITPLEAEAAAMLRSIAAEREAEVKRNDLKQMREHYIFEYEQEHGKGSFDATGE